MQPPAAVPVTSVCTRAAFWARVGIALLLMVNLFFIPGRMGSDRSAAVSQPVLTESTRRTSGRVPINCEDADRHDTPHADPPIKKGGSGGRADEGEDGTSSGTPSHLLSLAPRWLWRNGTRVPLVPPSASRRGDRSANWPLRFLPPLDADDTRLVATPYGVACGMDRVCRLPNCTVDDVTSDCVPNMIDFQFVRSVIRDQAAAVRNAKVERTEPDANIHGDPVTSGAPVAPPAGAKWVPQAHQLKCVGKPTHPLPQGEDPVSQWKRATGSAFGSWVDWDATCSSAPLEHGGEMRAYHDEELDYVMENVCIAPEGPLHGFKPSVQPFRGRDGRLDTGAPSFAQSSFFTPIPLEAAPTCVYDTPVQLVLSRRVPLDPLLAQKTVMSALMLQRFRFWRPGDPVWPPVGTERELMFGAGRTVVMNATERRQNQSGAVSSVSAHPYFSQHAYKERLVDYAGNKNSQKKISTRSSATAAAAPAIVVGYVNLDPKASATPHPFAALGHHYAVLGDAWFAVDGAAPKTSGPPFAPLMCFRKVFISYACHEDFCENSAADVPGLRYHIFDSSDVRPRYRTPIDALVQPWFRRLYAECVYGKSHVELQQPASSTSKAVGTVATALRDASSSGDETSHDGGGGNKETGGGSGRVYPLWKAADRSQPVVTIGYRDTFINNFTAVLYPITKRLLHDPHWRPRTVIGFHPYLMHPNDAVKLFLNTDVFLSTYDNGNHWAFLMPPAGVVIEVASVDHKCPRSPYKKLQKGIFLGLGCDIAGLAVASQLLYAVYVLPRHAEKFPGIYAASEEVFWRLFQNALCMLRWQPRSPPSPHTVLGINKGADALFTEELMSKQFSSLKDACESSRGRQLFQAVLSALPLM